MDHSVKGCKQDGGCALLSSKDVFIKKVVNGRLKPLLQPEKLRPITEIRTHTRLDDENHSNSKVQDLSLYKIISNMIKFVKTELKKDDPCSSNETSTFPISQEYPHIHNCSSCSILPSVVGLSSPINPTKKSIATRSTVLQAKDTFASYDTNKYPENLGTKETDLLQEENSVCERQKKLSNLVFKLRSELLIEQARQTLIIHAQRNTRKYDLTDIWQERFDAVDCILASFDMSYFQDAISDSKYSKKEAELLFTHLKKWKNFNERKWKKKSVAVLEKPGVKMITAADISRAVILNTERIKKTKFVSNTANNKIKNSLNGSDILSKPTQMSQSKINMIQNENENKNEKKMEIDTIPYHEKNFSSNINDDTTKKDQSKIEKLRSYSNDQNAVRVSFNKLLNHKSEAITPMSPKLLFSKSRCQPILKSEKTGEIVKENKGKMNIFGSDRNFRKSNEILPEAKKPSPENMGIIKSKASSFEIADIKGSKIQSNNNIEEKKKYNSFPIKKSVSSEITRFVTPVTNRIKKSKSESVTQLSFRDRLFAAVSVSSSEDMTKDFQSINLNTHSDTNVLSPSWKMQKENDIQQKQKQMQKISNWYISADNSPDGTLLESFGGTNITAAGAVYTSGVGGFYTAQPTLLLLGRKNGEMVGESNLSEHSSSLFDFLDDDDKTVNQVFL